MNQGIVMKINLTHAVVMNDSMGIINIKKKNGMAVGARIFYDQQDVFSRTFGLVPIRVNRLVFVMTILLLLMTLHLSTYAPRVFGPQVYAVVTVDINPSVELMLDQAYHVAKVVALNADAETLNLAKAQGKAIEEAVRIIMSEAAAQGYMADDGVVLIASSPFSTDINMDIDMRLAPMLSESEACILYYQGTPEMLSSAKEHQLSLGRYILSELIHEDTSAIVSNHESMSIAEIISLPEVQERLGLAMKKGQITVYGKGLSPSEPKGQDESREQQILTEEKAYSYQYTNEFQNQCSQWLGGRHTDNTEQRQSQDVQDDGQNKENVNEGNRKVTTEAGLQLELDNNGNQQIDSQGENGQQNKEGTNGNLENNTDTGNGQGHEGDTSGSDHSGEQEHQSNNNDETNGNSDVSEHMNGGKSEGQ